MNKRNKARLTMPIATGIFATFISVYGYLNNWFFVVPIIFIVIFLVYTLRFLKDYANIEWDEGFGCFGK